MVGRFVLANCLQNRIRPHKEYKTFLNLYYINYQQYKTMFGANFYDELNDSPHLPPLHNFIDFASYEPENNNTNNSFDLNFIHQPVSPVIFDRTQPIAPLNHQPFAFFQTLTFARPTEFSFTMTQPNPESLVLKKPKRQKKKKIETRKILAIAECSICLEDIKKNSKIPILQCKHEFHKKCLQSWMQRRESCPLCRLDICCDP